MARRCALLADKGVMTGNNVSHANNRTRRRFLPNLQETTFVSKVLGKVSLRVSTKAIRTVEVKGGIDSFLLSMANSKLTVEAAKLKNKLKKLSS